MPRFRAIAGSTVEADVSTGPQMVRTPWGMIAVRAGDVIVPIGDGVIPIPREVWQRWMRNVDPLPEPKPIEIPDKPISQLTRRELEALAGKHGVKLNPAAPMRVIIPQVKALVGAAR